MSDTSLRLLMLAIDPAIAELALDTLRRDGFVPSATHLESDVSLLELLDAGWDVILASHDPPRCNVLPALDQVTRRRLELPLIVVSDTGDEAAAVAAIRRGATDWLRTDQLGRLAVSVRRAQEFRRLKQEHAAIESAARASQESLAESQRLAHIGSWQWDVASGHLTWSDEHYRIFGLLPQAIEPSYDIFLDRVDLADRARVHEIVMEALTSAQLFQYECAILRDNGLKGVIHSRGIVVRDAGGNPVRVMGTVQDITERAAAEHAHQAAEARYRAVIEQVPAVIYTDQRAAGGQTLFVSPQIDVLLGYSPDAYIADPSLWEKRLHPDDRARVLAEVDRSTAAGKPLQTEYRLVARDGRIVWVRDEAMPVTDPADGTPVWQGVLLDVSERKALEDQLRHQAFHDALTGLPNRALVLDRLAQARARASRLGTCIAVLFLDLDNFKVVNDGLGHAGGDELLIAVGQRLRHSVRDGDTVARLGGDEFVCVLEDLAGPAEAEVVAARIAERLVAPVPVAGREIVATASVGIAVSGVPVEEPEALLRHADQAMYAAKNTGKARAVIFEPAMNARAWDRLELESDLRRAIENGELCLEYQPVVDLATGQVREVEAMLRWNHPVRGIVPPSDFVPIAEETELIVRLGRWVLEQACLAAMTWPAGDDGPPAVAVNLSSRQFDHPALVDEIARILADTGLPAARLRLEITERVALAGDAATGDILRALTNLGIGLVVDDFGTGYSGLGALKGSPVDAVKIDQTFVAGLGRDDRDTAIVRAVLALAGALGLRTTAEGVETAEQAAALRGLGCDQAQGFHFAHPASPAELQAFLEQTLTPLPIAG